MVFGISELENNEPVEFKFFDLLERLEENPKRRSCSRIGQQKSGTTIDLSGSGFRTQLYRAPDFAESKKIEGYRWLQDHQLEPRSNIGRDEHSL